MTRFGIAGSAIFELGAVVMVPVHCVQYAGSKSVQDKVMCPANKPAFKDKAQLMLGMLAYLSFFVARSRPCTNWHEQIGAET
jgi:hypothetical protein